MDLRQAAVVVLDGQNDFLSPGGVFYEAIEASNSDRPLIGKLNDLLTKARERGFPVINTRIVFDPGYPEVGDAPYGIFEAVKQSGGFQRGSWGAETAEGLEIQPDDRVFEKSGMSAFLNPDFEEELKRRGIKKLILAGLLTDACVECTMRAAYDKGYEVYAAADAIHTLDAGKHRVTVDGSFPLFSKPISADDL